LPISFLSFCFSFYSQATFDKANRGVGFIALLVSSAVSGRGPCLSFSCAELTGFLRVFFLPSVLCSWGPPLPFLQKEPFPDCPPRLFRYVRSANFTNSLFRTQQWFPTTHISDREVFFFPTADPSSPLCLQFLFNFCPRDPFFPWWVQGEPCVVCRPPDLLYPKR